MFPDKTSTGYQSLRSRSRTSCCSRSWTNVSAHSWTPMMTFASDHAGFICHFILYKKSGRIRYFQTVDVIKTITERNNLKPNLKQNNLKANIKKKSQTLSSFTTYLRIDKTHYLQALITFRLYQLNVSVKLFITNCRCPV